MWIRDCSAPNNRINNLHERALRIIHQDKKSGFETLLKNDKSRGKPTSFRHWNLQS